MIVFILIPYMNLSITILIWNITVKSLFNEFKILVKCSQSNLIIPISFLIRLSTFYSTTLLDHYIIFSFEISVIIIFSLKFFVGIN